MTFDAILYYLIFDEAPLKLSLTQATGTGKSGLENPPPFFGAPPQKKNKCCGVAKMGFLPAQQALGMQEPWPAPCRNLASSTSSTAARHKTPPVEGQMTAKMAPYLVRFLVHSRACKSKVTKNQPQATPQLGPITQQGCKTRNVASALQG